MYNIIIDKIFTVNVLLFLVNPLVKNRVLLYDGVGIHRRDSLPKSHDNVFYINDTTFFSFVIYFLCRIRVFSPVL